jgi:phosphatidylserine/phosphatidylglycerophosphate/cardiolipin synthase-like enzyme
MAAVMAAVTDLGASMKFSTNSKFYFLPLATLILLAGATEQASAIRRGPIDVIRELSGPYATPTRAIQENSKLTYAFDPYDAFTMRYKALSGEDYPRELFEKANSGVLMDTTCAADYPNAPKFKDILMVVFVQQNDFTGRLFNCLFEHHAKKGTRVRVMLGSMGFKDSLKKKFEELSLKHPNFSYRVHDGSFNSFLSRINLSLHMKSIVAIGENPADSFTIAGGRNLSDRYYFKNFPIIENASAVGDEFVYYADIEVMIHDQELVNDAFKVSRLFWHRLTNNFYFDARLPLSTQVKMLYASQDFDNYEGLNKKGHSYYLGNFEETMDVLGTLSLTRIKGGAFVYHMDGLTLLPELAKLINTTYSRYPKSVIYAEGQGDQQTSFRSELHQSFREKVAQSGLYPRVVEAFLKELNRNTTAIPTFDEWYDGIFKSIDSLIAKKNLDKVEEFAEIYRDRISDPLNLSVSDLQRTARRVKSKNGLIGSFNEDVYNEHYKATETRPQLVTPPNGDRLFVNLFSIPTQDGQALERALIDLINASQKEIRFVNCYFHPTIGMEKAMLRAANRGVEIYITTNTKLIKDDIIKLPEQATRWSINKLLGNKRFHFNDWGTEIIHVKIYQFDNEVIHLGSANLNRRTMLFNNENAVFIADPEFMNRFNRDVMVNFSFDADKAQATSIQAPVKEHGLLYKVLRRLLQKYL